MSSNRGLGKGLSALLGEVSNNQDQSGLENIKIDDIEPGIYQPRKFFDNNALYELADSIKKNGLIQPIVVVKNGEKYSIIAGERRWRAAKIAGEQFIPAILKELGSSSMLEHALIENIQRENLNVIEESEGYLRLMGEFGYTQDELSVVLNKSRSYVANILRLNNLPNSVKDKLIEGSIYMGHAKVLVGHPNAEEIADLIVKKGLNVRQSEDLVRNWSHNQLNDVETENIKYKGKNDADEISAMLSEKFDVKVKIEISGNGGKLQFFYNNPQQLDRLLENLMSI